MTFSVAVRTIPRVVDYFSTLDARIKQHLLPHPSVIGYHVSNRSDVTPNENACLAIEAACGAADWILFFEDDAEFIDDLVPSMTGWLDRHQDPHVHIYPLGYNYDVIKGAEKMIYRVSSYYGSVGLVLRASMMMDFVNTLRTHPEWMTRDAHTGIVARCLDLNLCRWHQRVESAQGHLLAPAPCYVNHLGVVSSLATAASHFTGQYPGYAGTGWKYHGRRA